jgi:hypothetical protein
VDLISASTGLPGESASRTMASDVIREISAPIGNAISTKTDRLAALPVIRRTLPGTMLWRLMASGWLAGQANSHRGRKALLGRTALSRSPKVTNHVPISALLIRRAGVGRAIKAPPGKSLVPGYV